MKKMKCFTAINGIAAPARVSGSDANCGHMSKKVANGNQVILRVKNRDFKEKPTHSQEPSREHPLSPVSTSNVTPNFHKRRWSVHYCRCGTSPVTVNKNKKQPQPPERIVSLPQPLVASHDPVKRYSCPPMGILPSPCHSSSSSTSSTTSSCSSPPVKTSVITGHDPLGWKLHPKFSSLNSQARAKRLSLQIPLPVIPDINTPKPEPSPKTKPTPKPNPPRRRHSDSAAFLQSPGTPLPMVTLDELCSVHLRPVALSDESDDVFNEEDNRVTTRKIPPPVPEKMAMARQIAQLIACSRQGCRPVPPESNKHENIYTSVMKPKPKYLHQNVDHSIHATKNAMQHLHISCDRERSNHTSLAKRSESRELKTPLIIDTIYY